MVFSSDDKAVIKNDYLEKGWTAYEICKRHPSKNWYKGSVQKLINRFIESGTMNRKPGSGRPRTVTTPENEEIVEQLICSQEDSPGTHKSPREIEKMTGIKRASVRRMVKRNGWKQYKRIKTPRVSEGTRKRRTERSGALAERFSNKRSVEKCVFQDEKDFTLDVPINHQNSRVYGKGKKADVSDKRLYHEKNRQSVKVMVSACVTWHGATKPFFVTNNNVKVNAQRYKSHLQKYLLPDIDRVVKRKDWILVQDSAPSHRSNLVQDFLKEQLKNRFIKHTDWPPASPDCNPLDFYFWDRIERKVYENRFNRAFKDEEALKRRIRKVWPEVASEVQEIRKAFKQFVPRLQAVHEKEGRCIKMLFG